MRRVLIRRPGGYDRLDIVDEPDPVAGDGEVVVDVKAIGVNYADCVIRMGLYASAKKYVGWPITPGFDVAGTTADGRRVIAVTRFGGYASRVVVPESQVFAMPEGMGFEEAAAFPTVFLTAAYALFELGAPSAGKRALVHSAAGGVGGALVQLLRIAECEVVGVVGRPEKVAAVPADKVFVREFDGEYDLVFDANGYKTLRKSYDALAPMGRLIVYGFHSMMPRSGGRPNWLHLVWGWLRTPRFNPLDMTGANKSVLAFNLSYLFDKNEILREMMGRLLGWWGEGKLKTPPVATYPLDRVADAHRDLESGTTIGKLVLTP
ncbi:MAG: synaptic vesicle VAT-1 family membrane protein [Planctomycetota bacterium]|jgi:NADPH:quinone reductase-like Zn-dependent oxidoreductase